MTNQFDKPAYIYIYISIYHVYICIHFFKKNGLLHKAKRQKRYVAQGSCLRPPISSLGCGLYVCPHPSLRRLAPQAGPVWQGVASSAQNGFHRLSGSKHSEVARRLQSTSQWRQTAGNTVLQLSFCSSHSANSQGQSVQNPGPGQNLLRPHL